MKTAMQELIEYLEKVYYVKEIIDWDKYKKELLEKEKEQIIDFAYGCVQHISREDIEEYYNRTYQKK